MYTARHINNPLYICDTGYENSNKRKRQSFRHQACLVDFIRFSLDDFLNIVAEDASVPNISDANVYVCTLFALISPSWWWMN